MDDDVNCIGVFVNNGVYNWVGGLFNLCFNIDGCFDCVVIVEIVFVSVIFVFNLFDVFEIEGVICILYCCLVEID